MDKHLTPAPCGIVCRTCRHLKEGCTGCFDGGGDDKCKIRLCVTAKAIDGCWDCREFPCELITAIDPAWQGMTIGLIQAVMMSGKALYSEKAIERIGEYAEYGDLRFKTPEEIKKILSG